MNARPGLSSAEKERRFVVAYVNEALGNGALAATLAGYAPRSAKITASRLLRKPSVRTALANLQVEIANQQAEAQRKADEAAEALRQATIADAAERRLLLTNIARNATIEVHGRLKAIDILNKLDGLYISKHLHTGRLTLEQLVAGSHSQPGAEAAA